MRFRIPPFLPPYFVLVLVITYAAGSLWVGLGRLDAITRLTDATARNAATVQDLQALVAAVNDVETAGRGFALTGSDSYLEPFERGRGRIPALLSDLRDRMRDDAVELALVEELVSLIAERTTITVAGIERKRSAPDQPFQMAFDPRGRETSEEIRAIVATLEAREQDELRQVRETLVKTMAGARADLYIMAGVTLLLVVSLFMAVRRLRAFMPLARSAGSTGATVEIAADATSATNDGGVGTLLHDALLRARLAAASAAAETSRGKELRSLIGAVEQAVIAHSSVYDRDQTQPAVHGIAAAMMTLVEAYSSAKGLTIKATVDQSVTVADAQKAFLVFRSAEWALEAITLRKRTGDVALAITTTKGLIFLRIDALTDDPKLPLMLTPKENEEANALRQGITALGGTFTVDEGPTGLAVTLTVPVDP